MMKRYVAVLVAILLLGFSSLAGATLFTGPHADFWAVDVGHDGVTLDVNLISTPATLWISTDNANWMELLNSTNLIPVVSTSVKYGDTVHLYLQLTSSSSIPSPKLAAVPIVTPMVTFNGESSLFIQWGGEGTLFPLTFITPINEDKIASKSPVPIPTAALLFGTGLIGFIGVRRKKLV